MSNINTDNIDVNYPIANQDNSSQGFRNNFQNIVSALIVAKSEISTLENVVALAAIPATPIGNTGDEAGMIAVDTANNWLYYCHTSYTVTNGSSQIWVRVEITPPAGGLTATTWDTI